VEAGVAMNLYGIYVPTGVIIFIGACALTVLVLGVTRDRALTSGEPESGAGMELDRFASYDPDIDEYPVIVPTVTPSLVFGSGGRRAQARRLSVIDQRVQSDLWPGVTPLHEVTRAKDAS
jgi:hypothetical protein